MRASRYSLRNSQHGAALVMGLLLLLVLTVLAVSGMNSASVEFVMAANDQFRQNAFQASETGIEQSLVVGQFNPANPADEVLPVTAVPNSATGDTYQATIRLALGGCTLPIYGSSSGSATAFQYDVTANGTSSRNSQATHSQGVQVLAPGSGAGYFTSSCGGGGGGGLN
jgi:type IV pilus assembly protein PilX